MLYRINYQNFLLYMIDYFTAAEIVSIDYAVVSAKVRNTNKAGGRVVSHIDYTADEPSITTYVQTQDKELLYSMYRNMLMEADSDFDISIDKKKISLEYCNIYIQLIKPILNHDDICLICDTLEDDYLDCLCRFIKDEFDVEVIDLNKLFTKGRIGSIYLDRDKVHDKFVKINRAMAKNILRQRSSTSDGRAYLIQRMSKKEKLKKLDEFGITPMEHDNIDQLLLEAWDEVSSGD